jgi:hypothetical protein
MILDVTNQEFNHILAALRLFQAVKWGAPVDLDFMTQIDDIATDDTNNDPLTSEELDDLCMRLNTESGSGIGIEIYRDYDDVDESGGAVTLSFETYGPNIMVKHKGVTWRFGVDLYYLAKDGYPPTSTVHPYNAVKRCVQIIADHPSTPENPEAHLEDPIQHLRVYEDGEVETFTC